MKKEKALTIAVLILSFLLVIETFSLLNRKHKNNSQRPPDRSVRQEQQQPKWTKLGATIDDFDRARAYSDPFQEMERMMRLFRENFSRNFMNENLGQTNPFTNNVAFEPDLDIQETGNEYVIKLDLPGMDKDKINVEVTDHLLTISGERKVENLEEKEGSYYKMERSFGSFIRTIPLPSDAKSEEMAAKYENGVMTIRMPKMSETKNKQESRKVEVR